MMIVKHDIILKKSCHNVSIIFVILHITILCFYFFFFSVGGRASLRQWRTVKYQLHEGQVQGVSSSKTEDLRSAQRIHLLEHMFQMTAITPQTPDFYLWGFLRAHVYENCPQSIAELKVAIIQKICAIRKEECVRVTDNSARRLQVCLRHNGGHLEHIL